VAASLTDIGSQAGFVNELMPECDATETQT